MKFKATLKMIWGLARSPELSMDSEELHLLVAGITGKDSLKELNQHELNDVAMELIRRKDPDKQKKQSRGNPATVWQRKKLEMLAQELGWDNPARLAGLAKKMFGVETVEWLDYTQCSKLIEAMKSMVKRKVVENEKEMDGAGSVPGACAAGHAGDSNR